MNFSYVLGTGILFLISFVIFLVTTHLRNKIERDPVSRVNRKGRRVLNHPNPEMEYAFLTFIRVGGLLGTMLFGYWSVQILMIVIAHGANVIVF